jgi:hypothetical protein
VIDMANYKKNFERRTGRALTDRDFALAAAYRGLYNLVAVHASSLSTVLGGRKRLPKNLRKYVASEKPNVEGDAWPWSGTPATASSGVKRIEDLRPFLRLSPEARLAALRKLRADILCVLSVSRALVNATETQNAKAAPPAPQEPLFS